MRNILIGIFIVAGGIIGIPILIFGSLYFLLPDLCGNQVISKSLSPNDKLVAYVFERNCGATTDYSYQLSILDSDQKLKNKSGNTFRSAQRFEIKWGNPYELSVNYPKGAEVFKKKKYMGQIKVHYESK